MAAWDLTPAELQDYAEVYRQRMEDQSYLAYNLAQCIAVMSLGSGEKGILSSVNS